MASLDEELQQQIEEEEQDQAFGNQQDQAEMEEEYRRRFARQQQQSKADKAKQQLQDLAGKVQTAQKWYKRYQKTVTVLGFLGSTSPIWGTLLLVLFIGGGFIVGCNNSIVFRAASGGACEPFILGSQAPVTFPSGGAGASTGFGYQGGTTDAEIRAYLAAAPRGIGINKANCAPNQQSNCTSLDGMKATTVDEITSTASDCDKAVNPNGPADNACGVQVTGGTEDKHAEGVCSHANGYKVDLAPTAAFNNYILNPAYFTPAGTRSDGAPLYKRTSDGAIYADERNIQNVAPHWDIVAPGCA